MDHLAANEVGAGGCSLALAPRPELRAAARNRPLERRPGSVDYRAGNSHRPSHGTPLQHSDSLVQTWP
jgi:hypothetical protein